jgi:hypothetical protein
MFPRIKLYDITELTPEAQVSLTQDVLDTRPWMASMKGKYSCVAQGKSARRHRPARPH